MLLLLLLLQADMAILDEIDSGLDIDALRDVAAAVNGLNTPERSVLMVTHYRVSGQVQWDNSMLFKA
jgi:Fe-S cluster assembly ATP-binding protein